MKPHRQLRAELNATGLNFIEAELEIGITFCAIARLTRDRQRRDRNVRNAQNALDSANRMTAKLDSTRAHISTIRAKRRQLEQLLEELGHPVQLPSEPSSHSSNS